MRTRTRAVSSLAALTCAVSVAATPSSSGALTPSADDRVGPGVMAYTRGAQCTVNFTFRDRTGATYVGYAAHCAGTGESTDTNGCQTRSLPLGTPVSFRVGGSVVGEGAEIGTGRLAYSSWRSMQKNGETRANPCQFNDFALVRVDAKTARRVTANVPFWGGPTGVNTTGIGAGERVYTYGNSSLRGDLDPLSPHVGVVLKPQGGGWSYTLYSIGPGIPGDSGSGFLDSRGRAVGILSTLGLLPLPASNNITDLHRALAYANRQGGMHGVTLRRGTKPFTGV